MAWSIMRDEAEAPPGILDECSRPGGRGATFSVDGSCESRPKVSEHESSFPFGCSQSFNRTRSSRWRGITELNRAASVAWLIPGVR